MLSSRTSLKNGMVIAVAVFGFLSVFFFVQHELNLTKKSINNDVGGKLAKKEIRRSIPSIINRFAVSAGNDSNIFPDLEQIATQKRSESERTLEDVKHSVLSFFNHQSPHEEPINKTTHIEIEKEIRQEILDYQKSQSEAAKIAQTNMHKVNLQPPSRNVSSVNHVHFHNEPDAPKHTQHTPKPQSVHTKSSQQADNLFVHKPRNNSKLVETKGKLVCHDKEVDSEIIYWKVVEGDNTFESPITPHHDLHHDRYLSFEYDQGGWNNVRMGMECLIVVAHAMGRTLVVPPQQHLYLLGKTHKDAHDNEAHDEMGFEDFFDIELLRSHKGFHVLHMEEFLAREGVTGGLHGILPPDNSSEAWGSKLWAYLKKVADEKPEWMGRFAVFPKHAGDFNMSIAMQEDHIVDRMKLFGGDRSPVFYDEKLQQAHHIHFPADGSHRLLQHFYAFAFFADTKMQSFYKRFVRDYMRYKDEIQCAGMELLQAVREDARKSIPNNPDGEFYALHIRRGDFQFKEVKIGAPEIVKNLHFDNGTSMIPRGAFVYLSTDDPDGICLNCVANRLPCDTYKPPNLPQGCPEDRSWKAFIEAGWNIRFLRDYTNKGVLKGVNPNTFGMVESIVCSRAKRFAGTYFSTFTGYIHRLRGYHGLGEESYYHSARFLMHLRMKKSVGHGFSREWRAGWSDDGGELI